MATFGGRIEKSHINRGGLSFRQYRLWIVATLNYQASLPEFADYAKGVALITFLHGIGGAVMGLLLHVWVEFGGVQGPINGNYIFVFFCTLAMMVAGMTTAVTEAIKDHRFALGASASARNSLATQETAFYFSRHRVLWVLAVQVILVLLGLYLLYVMVTKGFRTDDIARDTVLLGSLGSLAVLLGLSGFFHFFPELRHTDPGLSIGECGIFAARLLPELLPWTELEGANLDGYALILKLYDLDRLKGAPSLYRRAEASVKSALGLRGVRVYMKTLNADIREIRQALIDHAPSILDLA